MGIEKSNTHLEGLSEGLAEMLTALNSANAAFYSALNDVQAAAEEGQTVGSILQEAQTDYQRATSHHMAANEHFLAAILHLNRADLPDEAQVIIDTSRANNQFNDLTIAFVDVRESIVFGMKEVPPHYRAASQTTVNAIKAVFEILANEQHALPKVKDQVLVARTALKEYTESEGA